MLVRRICLPLSVLLTTAGTAPAWGQALWEDVTSKTIGETAEWSNKVELADINGDGRVDILFANGGEYHLPGEAEPNRVFLNRGPGQTFIEATEDILGPTPDLTRVIKVRDVSGDGNPDIIVAGSYQTQTRLYLGDGKGAYNEVTATHLPKLPTSAGDLEIGDVDGDGDLDLVLADWGPGDPCVPGALACPSTSKVHPGGRPMLWLNKGEGKFEDGTASGMPTTKVQWSWDFELLDVDNDFDLDLAISCKACPGSFLFHNDGKGKFTDKSSQMPQFTNNYEFEPIDLNGDGFLDLVTINDGDQVSAADIFDKREHVFFGDGSGGFKDATAQVWPNAANVGADDNAVVVLDFDSDGDPDFLIGALSGTDRLLVNDGGKLKLIQSVLGGAATPGTLGIAVADLDGDRRIDVVQSQGELDDPEKVYFGKGIAPDTAAPRIDLADRPARSGDTLIVRARIHDNKTPVMPHDFEGTPVVKVELTSGSPIEAPMKWYGGFLWRADIALAGKKAKTYTVCATDAAGNELCTDPIDATKGGGDNADCAAGADCEADDETGGCNAATRSTTTAGGLLLLAVALLVSTVRRRRC